MCSSSGGNNEGTLTLCFLAYVLFRRALISYLILQGTILLLILIMNVVRVCVYMIYGGLKYENRTSSLEPNCSLHLVCGYAVRECGYDTDSGAVLLSVLGGLVMQLVFLGCRKCDTKINEHYRYIKACFGEMFLMNPSAKYCTNMRQLRWATSGLVSWDFCHLGYGGV
ncbi:hypothetical protein VNO77_42137 [Canavalia gladiata]|uniref:Uncharacterized protein n=1 Tax=Canavalia gladiata TaxID=3824 RepID=A0AAN9PS54_CANGL